MKRKTFDFIDTPNHIGFISMKEDDTKRHRSRCNYYNKENKTCKHANSPFYTRKCGGSSHCLCYEEILKPEEQLPDQLYFQHDSNQHFSKYRFKKIKQVQELSDNNTIRRESISMEDYSMNFDTISRIIKAEFPKEVSQITQSLNNIDSALSKIVTEINKQTGEYLQSGNTSAAINILKEYEPFINKIVFNKTCIQKLLDQLS